MLDELERIKAQAEQELAQATGLADLEAWRLVYLGKKGALTAALRSIGSLPAEERPAAGKMGNMVRVALEEAFQARQQALELEALSAELASGALDVHLPGRPQSIGHAHLLNETLAQVYEIMGRMGFQVFRSPEIEDDVTNFQMLNLPPDHPARQASIRMSEDGGGGEGGAA